MLIKEETVLVVIDIQEVLLPKDKEVAESYIGRAAKLVRVARALNVPLLVTEQNPERLGGTHAEILDVLGDTPRMPKLEFGCMANPEFREALQQTGRRQLLIVGMYVSCRPPSKPWRRDMRCLSCVTLWYPRESRTIRRAWRACFRKGCDVSAARWPYSNCCAKPARRNSSGCFPL